MGWPDVDRPACRRGRDRDGLGTGPEESAALRRKLRLPRDHAGRDAIDVGDFGTAQAKRIRRAGLLLFGRVGVARRRQHRSRERGKRCAQRKRPDCQHGSPQPMCPRELWVKDAGMASARGIECCGSLRVGKRRDAKPLVQLGGLEPPTSCSTDRRSNQLSYNCIRQKRPQKRRRTGRKLGATSAFGKAGSVAIAGLVQVRESKSPGSRPGRISSL